MDEVGRGQGDAEDGLAFAAISDVDPQELTRYAELIRAPSP